MAMADGYAQASGELTVVNPVAPGLGNAMGMLYDARRRPRPSWSRPGSTISSSASPSRFCGPTCRRSRGRS